MTPVKSVFDVQLEMLHAELTQINSAIRQHDDLANSAKNWAVVTWTASIGLALNSENLHSFIWVTGIVPLVFWIVDGTFRRIQRSFINRVAEIADFVNSSAFRSAAETGTEFSFELLRMRHKSKEFKNTLIGTMLFRSVSLLYAGLILCSLVVWMMVKP